MNNLPGIIPDKLLHSIGWTLFHSLWIGAVVGIVAFLVIRLFKDRPASVKYNISLSFLVLFIFLVSFTFIKILQSTETVSRTETGMISNTPALSHSTGSYISEAGSRQADKDLLPPMRLSLAVKQFVNTNYNIIAIIWIAGILIMSFRFTLDMKAADRLKMKSQKVRDESLLKSIKELCLSLDISRKIQLLTTSLTDIPFTSGIIKPVIIIPAEILTGMPYAQVEMIIAHELAHIKRNDYLVNIFQSLVEIIFFFHPAIWYMSSLIRTEREICCDNMAITYGKDKITYIKALLTLGESAHQKVKAVAFTGNESLLNRIKTITGMKRTGNNLKGKAVSALISILLFTGIIIFSAFSLNNESHSQVQEQAIQSASGTKATAGQTQNEGILQDTIIVSGTIKNRFTDPADNTEKELKIKFEDGKVEKLVIDGIVIPESEYDRYSDIIDKNREDLKDALEDIQDLDLDEMAEGIEEALEGLSEIDFEGIMESFESFDPGEFLEDLEDIVIDLEDLEAIDFEEMLEDVSESIKRLNNFEFEFDDEDFDINIDGKDFSLIEKELRENLEELENIDLSEWRKEMEEAILEIRDIDFDNIREEYEKSIKEYNEIDHDKVMEEVEQSLKELKKSLSETEFNFTYSLDNYEKSIESRKKWLRDELEKLEAEEKDTKKSEGKK